LPESFKVGHLLPQKQTGSAAGLPYHKPKAVGLTCRSAPILGTRSSLATEDGRQIKFVPFVPKFCAVRQKIISPGKPQPSYPRRRKSGLATARRWP
jgi:hypothetical protein